MALIKCIFIVRYSHNSLFRQHEACNHGCLEIVQLLLDSGAFIDVPGCDHDTPLHDAIANSRLEVAEFLISKGASLDVR